MSNRLRRLEQTWNADFELQPIERDAEHEAHPDIETLCRASGGEEVELCELGEWVDVGGWALTTLVMPEDGSSLAKLHFVVARTERGLRIVGELGNQVEDDRMFNSYVRQVVIEPEGGPTEDEAVPLATVSWERGSASADGCGWEEAAWEAMLFCANDDGDAFCFASAMLGPTTFTSDSMLPSVQESLGNCEDWEPTPPEPSAEPSFTVSYDAREMVVVRMRDDRTRCLPMPQTLCALPSAPASCAGVSESR